MKRWLWCIEENSGGIEGKYDIEVENREIDKKFLRMHHNGCDKKSAWSGAS